MSGVLASIRHRACTNTSRPRWHPAERLGHRAGHEHCFRTHSPRPHRDRGPRRGPLQPAVVHRPHPRRRRAVPAAPGVQHRAGVRPARRRRRAGRRPVRRVLRSPAGPRGHLGELVGCYRMLPRPAPSRRAAYTPPPNSTSVRWTRCGRRWSRWAAPWCAPTTATGRWCC